MNRSDILWGGAFAFIAMLVCAEPAWAYVDPSVMTYTIQALAGVAVALSAVAGVALRRTRKALLKALNIDENAKKNVEPVVHRVDPVTGTVLRNSCDDVAEAAAAARANRPNRNNAPIAWPARLGMSLLACFLLFYTTFMVAPCEVIAANGKDLLLKLDATWLPMLLFAIALTVVCGFLLSALRGKAFSVGIGLVTALGFCSWAQALFLNYRLPIADGAFLYWGDFTQQFIVGAIAWIVIIALFLVVMLKWRPIGNIACGFVAIALVIMQTVGLASLSFAPQHDQHEFWDGNYTTQEGLFDLSEKSNVVVFVLDMFDNTTFNTIVEKHPDVLTGFTGFTAFTNTTGEFIPTRYAVPYLLTGQTPRDDDQWYEFVDQRYERSSFIKDIYDAGYSVGVYSTNIENGTDNIAPYTVNIHRLQQADDPNVEKTIDPLGVIRAMSQVALFRNLPWVFKPAFWFYTDEINDMVAVKPVQGRENKNYGVIPYRINDIEYYQTLRADKLELNDTADAGAFRFIHLEGAHWPFVMDENGNRANTDIEHQSMGALRIVNEYLSQMKELGVYDNATIVVTSDHGNWEWAQNNEAMDDIGNLYNATAPFMLVKPAGSSKEPIAYSSVQTGHVDYPATIMQAVYAKASSASSSTSAESAATSAASSSADAISAKYGITVFDAPASGRERTTYVTHFDGHNDVDILKFSVVDDANVAANWKLVDTLSAAGTIYSADRTRPAPLPGPRS